VISKLTRAISDRLRDEVRFSNKAIYKSTLLRFIFALQQTADIVKIAMTLELRRRRFYSDKIYFADA